jgi:hypothetical protein
MELKRRVDLVPVLVEDLKELLVFMFIEDERADPGAQAHQVRNVCRTCFDLLPNRPSPESLLDKLSQTF